MVQMFDHRAADVVVSLDNVHRAAYPQALTGAAKEQPDRFPTPQFWVLESDLPNVELEYALTFKDVTAPTNVRTMIAAIVPRAGFGNTLPMLQVAEANSRRRSAKIGALLLANMASLACDFVARQKVQGQHLNWFIVEQLPVIDPSRFESKIGATRIADFVREQVLHLSYTAHDLAPFARDLGHVDSGGDVLPPFRWDEEDRRRRMAALDGLFMHLYGLDEDDAAYVLDSFPIVREQDQTDFGHFRTKDDVLAALRRVRSGVLSVEVPSGPCVDL
jgi:hypothetical protein